MYNFIINLNTLIASLFLCIWFVIYTSVLTTKSKKDLIQLILITTILIMKISYILNRMKIDSLVMNNYGLLYMFIVENIVILMIFYFFHYYWFTVFCQFSTIQQGDSVTHKYIHSFSHIIMLPHK